MFREVLLIALCSVVTADHHVCQKDGVVGVCVNINKCRTALQRGPIQDLSVCGYNLYTNEVSICCFDHITTTTAPTRRWKAPTSEEDNSCETYGTCYEPENTCLPIAPRTGRKASDMCLEYQETLVNPCRKTNALVNGGWTRISKRCPWNTGGGNVIGGVNAAKNEFPHMNIYKPYQSRSFTLMFVMAITIVFFNKTKALLGNVVPGRRDIAWVCGGSLISDKFILTAAHCIWSREHGKVSFAYLGVLTRKDVTANADPRRKYSVKNIFRHPEYLPPSRYNDIALLELEEKVILDENTVPACLPVHEHLEADKGIATGWGRTEHGSNSDELQKVILTKFNRDECKEFYPSPTPGMREGYNDTIQMCYGDREKPKDTCQGDSGGPLQIRLGTCMYTIVGITSTGNWCGFTGQPGIYTRVSYYVPWIESVVWP